MDDHDSMQDAARLAARAAGEALIRIGREQKLEAMKALHHPLSKPEVGLSFSEDDSDPS